MPDVDVPMRELERAWTALSDRFRDGADDLPLPYGRTVIEQNGLVLEVDQEGLYYLVEELLRLCLRNDEDQINIDGATLLDEGAGTIRIRRVALPHQKALLRDLQHVDETWKRDIGPHYAATIINGDYLVILVTSKQALLAADLLRGTLVTAESVFVRLVSPRLQRSEMDRIMEEVAARVPDIPFGIGYESPVNRPDCPRIRLQIPYSDPRIAELGQRWADEAIAEYGDDRISVEVGEVVQW